MLTYLDIGRELEISTNPEEENMQFWADLYKTYGTPPYDTY